MTTSFANSTPLHGPDSNTTGKSILHVATTLGFNNETNDDEPDGAPALWVSGMLTFLESLIILFTVVGNTFVVVAILKHKPLRSYQNYFLISLAAADLAVGVLVMPFHIAYFLNGWVYAPGFCEAWVTMDVFLCTASILNLCVIALDRYWSIHDAINYAKKRSWKKVAFMITAAWIVSLAISVPPVFGWADEPLYNNETGTCELNSEKYYVVYSACGSFYVPLVLLTFLYGRVYMAIKRYRKRHLCRDTSFLSFLASRHETHSQTEDSTSESERLALGTGNTPTTSVTNLSHDWVVHQEIVYKPTAESSSGETQSLKEEGDHHDVTSNNTNEEQPNASKPKLMKQMSTSSIGSDKVKVKLSNQLSTGSAGSTDSLKRPKPKPFVKQSSSSSLQIKLLMKQHSSGHKGSKNPRLKSQSSFEVKYARSLTRERRAARVLAIVMIAFVLCWLPFFIAYIIGPFCDSCVNGYVMLFFIWLGYVNSFLNPIIYTVFNREFRKAFIKFINAVHCSICRKSHKVKMLRKPSSKNVT